MKEFDYIKKVNIVVRTITEKNHYLIFKALCNRELSLEELQEFKFNCKFY